MRTVSWFRRHERGLVLAWLVSAPLVLLVLAWAVLSGAADRAVRERIQRWPRAVERCATLVEEGRVEEALARLERLDRSFPGESVRHRHDGPRELSLALLGECYLRQGERELALATHARLAEFDPRHWQNHFRLAQTRLQLDEREGARDALENVLAIHPSHLPSVRALARLHAEDGRPGHVLELFGAYLDAVLYAPLVLRAGETRTVLHVRADGRVQHVTAPFDPGADWDGVLELETGGYSVRLEEVALVGPLHVGSLEPRARRVLSGTDGGWQATGARPVEPGLFAADSPGARLRLALDRPPPCARIELRVTVHKAVDAELWRLVEASQGAGGDALRELRARTVLGGCLEGGSTWPEPGTREDRR
jgi:hypothetical protein